MQKYLLRKTSALWLLFLTGGIGIAIIGFGSWRNEEQPKLGGEKVTERKTSQKPLPQGRISPASTIPRLAASKALIGTKEKKKASIVKSHYATAPVRFQEVKASPEPGYSQRVTVVETQLKHPLVRVVDTLIEDPDTLETVVLNSVAMAADHVLVEVPDGVDIASLLEGTGFGIRKQFSFSPNVLVSFPPAADPAEFEALLARVASQVGSEVMVEPDFLVYPSISPDDPSFENGTQWNMENFGQTGGSAGADISATDAWTIRTDASSVLVGVVDTGIRTTHQDLVGNLWNNPGEIAGNGIDDDGNGVIDDVHGFNAIEDNGDPSDSDGHGTHVSGIVGAQGNNDTGVTGVAWDVQLMGLRFLGAQGGFTSDAIEAIDYGRSEGVQILNNSWGGGGFSNALQSAIQRAENADILFVVAAGNDSLDNDASPAYPASYTLASVVSVASSTRTDSLSGFSNFGATSVDLAAPGSTILSTFNSSDTDFATLSGTSMASPHVAGAAAILRAEFPDETFAEIKARLLDTVDLISAFAGTSVTGGRLNLLGALRNEAVPNPGVLSFGLATTNVAETAGSLAVIVSRDVGSDGAISVTYQTQNGSALVGSDFANSTGTLTWADGDMTERIINIPILDDDSSEGAERFTVELSNATGGATLAGGNALGVTILDDESTLLDGFQFEETLTEGSLSFFGSPAPAIATGADDSVGWVNLNFVNGNLEMIVRRYLPNGTLDWERTLNSANPQVGGFQPRIAVGPSGELVVAYSDISQLNNVSIVGLDIAVAAYSATGNLLWNRVLEGDSARLDLANAVSVAADGSIYVAGTFSEPNGLSAGDQQTYLTRVSPTDGSQVWLRTEDFDPSISVSDEILSLAIASDGTVFAGGSTVNQATGFIGGLLTYSPAGELLISETYPAVEQQRVLSVAANSFGELFLGLRTFNNVSGIFNARLLRVSPVDGSIIWQRAEAVGDATPNFLITTNPNGLIYFVEGDENLSSDNTWSVGLYDRDGERLFENAIDAIAPLSISSIANRSDGSLVIAGGFSGQAQFGGTTPNSGADADAFLTSLSPTADLESGELVFESETYSSFESNSSLEVTILRQGGVDGEVTVEVATQEDVALAGEDFEAITGETISFLPGQRSATFILTLVNDFVAEGSEPLALQLSNPSGGARLGAAAQASVLILNDDFAYEEFVAGFFSEEELGDALLSGPEADPDGDGLNNLTEYAFGLNPREPSPDPTSEITLLEDSEVALSYRRSDGDDLSFSVMSSPDLVSWTVTEVLSEESVSLVGEEGVEDTTVTVPANGIRQFFRIEAVRADLGIGAASE